MPIHIQHPPRLSQDPDKVRRDLLDSPELKEFNAMRIRPRAFNQRWVNTYGNYEVARRLDQTDPLAPAAIRSGKTTYINRMVRIWSDQWLVD